MILQLLVLIAFSFYNPFVIGDIQGKCTNTSDCFGLGDCVNGFCRCDMFASGAKDCSRFATLPLDWEHSGYRNNTSPSWGGTFISSNGLWHGFTGSMIPGFVNRTVSFGDSEVVHIVSTNGPGGPYNVVGVPIKKQFRADMHQLPGGGFVLFSEARGLPGKKGLSAGFLSNLDEFPPVMNPVFLIDTISTEFPWLCHAFDWTATVLPDGSVLASFRNGGHHCPEDSYPGWPAEQIGLARGSCWNCSDYELITMEEPLFGGVESNEDPNLFWTHRGLHMILHSQNNTGVDHRVRGTIAFSPDKTGRNTDLWVISQNPLYNGTILLNNGTSFHSLRRQRPGVIFAEDNYNNGTNMQSLSEDLQWPKRVMTHLTNAVDMNCDDNAWGDGWNLVQPLRYK